MNQVDGIDWLFNTVPQRGANNRKVRYARGKCSGGSSARNFMVGSNDDCYRKDELRHSHILCLFHSLLKLSTDLSKTYSGKHDYLANLDRRLFLGFQ